MYLTIKLLETGGKVKSQVINDLSKFMMVSELKAKIEERAERNTCRLFE
jgi:hypothetical protein